MKIIEAVAILLVAACASAGKRGAACTTVTSEERGSVDNVFRSCAVDVPAALMHDSPRPEFTPTRPNACARIELEMVVDSAGLVVVPSVRTKRSTDRGLADAVNAILPSLRYNPAQKEGAAVAQLVVYSLNIASRMAPLPVGASGGGSVRRAAPAAC